jgi:hypothetical protein
MPFLSVIGVIIWCHFLDFAPLSAILLSIFQVSVILPNAILICELLLIGFLLSIDVLNDILPNVVILTPFT